VIGLPFAHVGGIPIEETLGSFGPVLLLVAGAALARLGDRVRRLRPERAFLHVRRVADGVEGGRRSGEPSYSRTANHPELEDKDGDD